MNVRSVRDPAEFLDVAGPLLLHDEARHNLILGIVGTLRDHPEVYSEHYLWVVEAGVDPLGAALMTPPYNLVLADPVTLDALGTLAEYLRAARVTFPGVVGNLPHVDRFAEGYARTMGSKPFVRIAQGVYALRMVREVRKAPGRGRRATTHDRDLVVAWTHEFSAEALPAREGDDDRTERMVDFRLDADPDDSGMWLWVADGRPLSLAGYGGNTPNGIRVGPVYTPPELRGRGYATSLVAEMSSWLLARG